jgi:anti-anti-sigma factor
MDREPGSLRSVFQQGKNMTIASSLKNNQLIIEVTGRFDFSTHLDFRKAYESLETPPDSYVVNMKLTSYLDSSALGMLLLLRDYAGGEQADISIMHCNEEVKKILSISKFEELFTIA